MNKLIAALVAGLLATSVFAQAPAPAAPAQAGAPVTQSNVRAADVGHRHHKRHHHHRHHRHHRHHKDAGNAAPVNPRADGAARPTN